MMRKILMNLSLVALFATGLLLGACGENNNTPTGKGNDTVEVDKLVSELMGKYNIPGLGLGVVKEGKVIYTKGYGVRSTQTKTPVTPNTQFAIGSITKSFTALAVGQLVDRGKLNLDTPVVNYLLEVKFSDPLAAKITLRHLLSHTSGIPDFPEAALVRQNLSREQMVQQISQIKLATEPGNTYVYSNLGYTLVGYIVEKVSGEKWEDYIRQQILNSLDMKTASFGVANVQKTNDYALPHAQDILKGNQPIPFANWLESVAPAGNINANISEMTEYMRFQLGKGKALVSDAFLKEMYQVQTKDNPFSNPNPESKLIRNKGYGFGWIVGEYSGQEVISHNGGLDGFYSYLTLLPQSNSGVVLLTNIDYSTPVASPFAEALRINLIRWLLGLDPITDIGSLVNKESGFNLDEYTANLESARSYKPDPEALKALEGDYTLNGEQTTVISFKDNRLYANSNGNILELVPFKKDAFLGNSTGIYSMVFTVKTEADGSVRFLMGGQPVGEKLPAGQKPNVYTDPKGRFKVTIPTGLKAESQGDRLVIKNNTPAATFILTAVESSNEELPTATSKLSGKLYPNLKQPPQATTQIPLPNGQVWTQFIYQLSDTELVVVLGIKQKDIGHFIILQANTSDVQNLVPNLNSLILGYKITQ